MASRLSGKLLQLSASLWDTQLALPLTHMRSFGVKAISPPQHTRYNIGPGLPVLESTPAAALRRKANSLPLRSGAIGIKKGMTALFDPETGKRTACTVLQLDRVEVISHKTVKKHGYWAVQVGAGWKHPSNVNKALLGHFSANGLSPKRHIFEFRVKDESGLTPVGESIHANWFLEGQFVDARSNTKGKGFAGVMKRHGFHGQDRSHGVSLTHRSLGSAGPSQGGGSRVYPGKKMAGRMGNNQNTVQNLKILQVDAENGIVVVSGHISGPKGCSVRIQDAIKKPWPEVPSATESTATAEA
ncbi:Translation elongation/initiation factor/Ribosomal beta-barrel [Penicillium taxi]|uniref:Translation elongation/initiation factor/Ribosomal beta-barrel n=1 Tax=Penicillium taxi TaxID=168475 RepID=UPI002544D614|nr:Translation elongation/initiation factor/Ribosomal beta-barrel [Penicillium taxi]KAJ5907962.1 Translation elongation/initiation factor/Ribosomal beta-barrel [Penicillium taxi]